MFDSKSLNPILSMSLRSKISHFSNCDTEAYLFLPEDISELKKIIKNLDLHNQEFQPLGAGSNLLIGKPENLVFISDKKLPRKLETTNEIVISANQNINFVMMKLAEQGIGGLEFLAGVPAHLGGIIKMNAGALGQTIGKLVKGIKYIDRKGIEHCLYADEIDFSYRKCSIDGFIFEVALDLPEAKPKDIKVKIRSNIEYRRKSQPLEFSNLGCFYKNPTGENAGRLIDLCGCKGKTIGDASISEKHANFIINKGNATFADTIALMEYVERMVYNKFKIKLVREIEVIG